MAAPWLGRIGQLFFEYVGNLDPPESDRRDAPPVLADRRRNVPARELVDWVRGQMQERGFTPEKEQQLLRDLRTALRDEREG